MVNFRSDVFPSYYFQVLTSDGCRNCIRGVMVSVLALSVVDRGLDPRSGQTKDYKIGICCFSAKHTALRRKNKDWLSRNQDNVSKWHDMSTRELLFLWASTIKIQLRCWSSTKLDLIIISLNINLFWKIAELALNNNHSLTLMAAVVDFQCIWFHFVLVNILVESNQNHGTGFTQFYPASISFNL